MKDPNSLYYRYITCYHYTWDLLHIRGFGQRPRYFATKQQLSSYYAAQYRLRNNIFNPYAKLRRSLPQARTALGRAIARRRIVRNRRIATIQRGWRLRRQKLMKIGSLCAPAA
jgi:hypothetical protein